MIATPTTLPVLLTDRQGILNTVEAAALLTVSPKTMARWRTTGDGPAFVRFGQRTMRYRRSDLDAYVSDRRARSTLDRHGLATLGAC